MIKNGVKKFKRLLHVHQQLFTKPQPKILRKGMIQLIIKINKVTAYYQQQKAKNYREIILNFVAVRSKPYAVKL